MAMHSPGICSVILADRHPDSDDTSQKATLDAIAELIDVLNAETDLVIVAAAHGAEALEPLAWVHAAYFLQLPATASHADALRIALQDVLSRGRDTVLLASPADRGLTSEAVHRMIAAYCGAGDEIWAVVPNSKTLERATVLLGRSMIEVFLRSQSWSTATEVLTANREHFCALATSNESAGAAQSAK